MILTLGGYSKLTAAGLAAVLAIVVIGLAACGSSESNEIVAPGEPVPVTTPEPTAAPGVGTPVVPEETADPPEDSASLGLVWTEVDLAETLGADKHSTIRLQSVGDGRVLVLSFIDRGMDSILVTENSTEWIPIPVPAGFLPWSVDITGNRWLLQGLGRGPNMVGDSPHILFSDDQGSNWTQLLVDLGPLAGAAWIVNAVVAGELIVVVAQSDIWQPDSDQGLDDDMTYGSNEDRVHLFLSDGGPAELVAEFPGWASGGYGASDGFHLMMYGPDGDELLTSPDGREWTRTAVDVEVTDSARNEVWTSDEGYTDYRIERFEGIYGSGQVLTLPVGIGWVPDFAVGPAGIAAVGGPASTYEEPQGEFTLPDIVVEKDGYELRYNQPVGGITLWDLEDDLAVYVFDAETLQREEPPDVVQEVEGDDGTDLVVFLDPETRAELVVFSGERLAAAVMEAAIMEEETTAYSDYDPNQFLIGWSADGTDWEWQTLQEAFGLPERSQDDNSFTEVQVAVGHHFVLAKVQTFVFPEAEFDESTNFGVGDRLPSTTYTGPEISASPHRWFIARVG